MPSESEWLRSDATPSLVPRMNRPKIFQIYYKERQGRYLDPAFTPWFNLDNPRPEWREYWVFRTVYKGLDFQANSHIGYVSWKFGQKCRVSGQSFLDFIQTAPERDVYFVNPAPHATLLYKSVWTHGESHHPGILAFVKSVFAKVHPDIEFDQIRTPPDKGAFCNYWVGNERFWKAYLDLCEPIFDYMENKVTREEKRFINRIADESIRAPYHPFIMERMFSTLLAVRPDITSLQFPLPERALQKLYGNTYDELLRARQVDAELERIGDLALADRVRELFLEGFLGNCDKQAQIDSMRSPSLVHVVKGYLKYRRPRTYKFLKIPIKTLVKLANR